MKSSTYLIYDPLTRLHKIGITGMKGEKRLRAFKKRYMYGEQLEMILRVESDKDIVKETEKTLHELFEEKRRPQYTYNIREDWEGNLIKMKSRLMNGGKEWFDLNEDDVKFVIETLNSIAA